MQKNLIGALAGVVIVGGLVAVAVPVIQTAGANAPVADGVTITVPQDPNENQRQLDAEAAAKAEAARIAAEQEAARVAAEQAAAQAAAEAQAQAVAQQQAANRTRATARGQVAGAPGSRVPFVPSSDPNNANGGDYQDPGTFCQSGSASGNPPVCD